MEDKILTEFDREIIDKEFERQENFCNKLEEMLRINRELRQSIGELRESLEQSIEKLKANKPPKIW